MNVTVTAMATRNWECATMTRESVSVWTILLVWTVRTVSMVTMATLSE